jgi:hypothetical protein
MALGGDRNTHPLNMYAMNFESFERQFDKINIIATVYRYRSSAKVDSVIPTETMQLSFPWPLVTNEIGLAFGITN